MKINLYVMLPVFCSSSNYKNDIGTNNISNERSSITIKSHQVFIWSVYSYVND